MLIVFIPQFFARRSNPNKSDILFLSDVQRLHASHLNTSNPVIVYLHGFSESAPGGPGQSSQELRDGKHLQFNTNKQTEQKIAFAELKSIHFFVVFVFIMRYRNVVCVCVAIWTIPNRWLVINSSLSLSKYSLTFRRPEYCWYACQRDGHSNGWNVIYSISRCRRLQRHFGRLERNDCIAMVIEFADFTENWFIWIERYLLFYTRALSRQNTNQPNAADAVQ